MYCSKCGYKIGETTQISYQLNYAANYYYISEFMTSKKFFEMEHPDNKVGQYTAYINGTNVDVYYFDYKDSGKISRETYVLYPVSNDYYLKIILEIDGVTKDNIDEYVMITDMRYNAGCCGWGN